MDTDGLSSPPAPGSSLPQSSAPNPTASSNGTPRSVRRPATDALAFGNSDAQDAQGEGETGARQRRRPRNQPGGDVPMVRDAVGESVCESFETFLKTCVVILCPYLRSSPCGDLVLLKMSLCHLRPPLMAAYLKWPMASCSMSSRSTPCANTISQRSTWITVTFYRETTSSQTQSRSNTTDSSHICVARFITWSQSMNPNTSK